MSYAPMRIAAGSLVVAVLGAGFYLSGKAERASRARVAALQEGGHVEAEAEVGSLAEDMKMDPARFAEQVAADATAFGVSDATITALGAAQAHVVLIKDAVVVNPGRAWTGGGLEIRAAFEKVTYQDRGATVSAKHSVLTVTNASDRPIAWFMRTASAGTATCEVRGARMHNAMALRPRESAEVVVCAGPGKPQILRLEILGISELGYAYISQVPPAAVGHDAIIDRAHRPAGDVRRCDVDARTIAGAVRDGRARWVDVADFYSRHNCQRHAFFVGYRWSDGAVARLPATPPP